MPKPDYKEMEATRMGRPKDGSATTRRAVTPVDIYVAGKLRQRRIIAGLTVPQMAGALGISRTQYNKFERHVNRMSAATLFEVSRVLGCSTEDFFEGLDAAGIAPLVSTRQEQFAEFLSRLTPTQRSAIETLATLSPAQREVVVNTIKVLATS